MNRIVDMLQTHPQGSEVDAAARAACVEACMDCAQSCVACADACLGEEDVGSMVACIRRNQDCADVCAATAAVASRITGTDLELVRAQVEACRTACRVCAEECERHAGAMEHCRVCAEVCRRCESACADLIAAMEA